MCSIVAAAAAHSSTLVESDLGQRRLSDARITDIAAQVCRRRRGDETGRFRLSKRRPTLSSLSTESRGRLRRIYSLILSPSSYLPSTIASHGSRATCSAIIKLASGVRLASPRANVDLHRPPVYIRSIADVRSTAALRDVSTGSPIVPDLAAGLVLAYVIEKKSFY